MTMLAVGVIADPAMAFSATPYLRASGGIGLMNDVDYYWVEENTTEKDELDAGFALEGAFGIKRGILRIEAAAAYQSNEVYRYVYKGVAYDPSDEKKTFTYSVWSYMVNVYTDYNENGQVSPFVMAGIGVADVDFTRISLDDRQESGFSECVFAWQAGFGAGIRVTDALTLDLGYRYFAAAGAEGWNEKDRFDLSTSNFMLGARYRL